MLVGRRTNGFVDSEVRIEGVSCLTAVLAAHMMGYGQLMTGVKGRGGENQIDTRILLG